MNDSLCAIYFPWIGISMTETRFILFLTILKVMQEISFDNIQNAFEYKSDAEINRAYWLFKAISNNTLVKAGPVLVDIALKLHLPISGIVKATLFKHFCGGENINECYETVEQLAKFNVGSILDYSVEGKEEESEFDHSAEEILATVERAKGDPHIPFCVFKITGLGRFALLEKVSAHKQLSSEEEQEYAKVQQRVKNICERAFKNNVPIFIDAEESWIQQAIDDLATGMMMLFNKERAIVYNTIQLYRHDRLEFLKQSLQHAIENNYRLGEKLVRGAYMEKERKRAAEMGYPTPIQPDKAASDRDYDAALKFCIEHLNRVSICAGTHNEQSSMMLVHLMQQNQIVSSDKRIYFSQLLGMSDHISFNLAKAGYNVCKYIPYGPVKAVLPYLMRRAQENTSIRGQMGRELILLSEERKRRKREKKIQLI